MLELRRLEVERKKVWLASLYEHDKHMNTLVLKVLNI